MNSYQVPDCKKEVAIDVKKTGADQLTTIS
jgi:hypothetical protein